MIRLGHRLFAYFFLSRNLTARVTPNAATISISSAADCHSREITETTAALLSGIISISPASIIPSRTPSPEGANTARIPIIADIP